MTRSDKYPRFDTAPLTASERKAVRALELARHRRETGLFVAEGTKCVIDTLGAFELDALYATRQWAETHAEALGDRTVRIVSAADIERMSLLSTPSGVLAVYHIPERALHPERLSGSLVMALDRVQDPGNLGTLIRLCDWFGIEDMLISTGTASPWNAKSVQASMGAIARVRIHQVELDTVLSSWPGGVPVAGTFLDGNSIYETALPAAGVIVMGNEGRGISEEIEKCCTLRLTIPSYPPERPTSESLNVAMAASVIVSEWRRRQLCSR